MNMDKIVFINYKKRSSGHGFNTMQLSNDLFALFNSTHNVNINDYFGRLAFIQFCKDDAPHYIEKFVQSLKEVKHVEFKVQKYLYGQTLQNRFILTYDNGETGDFIFNINWFIKPVAGN